MRHCSIRKSDYLKAGQLFHWATIIHYILWFTGRLGRHKRTEVMLPGLVREGRLRAVRYGKKLVYAVPRVSKGQYHIEHGLACTEGLVRFWRSDMNGSCRSREVLPGTGVHPGIGGLFTTTPSSYTNTAPPTSSQEAGRLKAKCPTITCTCTPSRRNSESPASSYLRLTHPGKR